MKITCRPLSYHEQNKTRLFFSNRKWVEVEPLKLHLTHAHIFVEIKNYLLLKAKLQKKNTYLRSPMVVINEGLYTDLMTFWWTWLTTYIRYCVEWYSILQFGFAFLCDTNFVCRFGFTSTFTTLWTFLRFFVHIFNEIFKFQKDKNVLWNIRTTRCPVTLVKFSRV